MFWYKTFCALCVLTLALTACSVRPLYGSAFHTIGIEIESGGNEAEKKVKKQLQNKFSARKKINYLLKLDIDIRVKNILVPPDGDVSLKEQRAKAVFHLLDRKTKKSLLTDSFTTSLVFNQAGDSPLSRLAAEKDAKERIIKKLTTTIQRRLIAFWTTEEKSKAK